MFHSLFKTAWRSLFKTKLSSFIHLVGLSLGLSCCLIIGLYVFEEFKYDRHFKDLKSLFRVVSYYKGAIGNGATIETPAALGAELKDSFGEIEAVTRMLKTDRGFLFADHKAFQENIIFVDGAFLDVFQFDVIEGSKRSCLARPHSVIVSESMAGKMYGANWREQNIIGNSLLIDDRFEYTLSAVFKDFSAESHFHSNIFLTDPKDFLSDDQSVYTYVRLKEGSFPEQLTEKARAAFSDRDWFIRGKYDSFELQPVADIHLYSKLDEENDSHGTIRQVYAFSLIAVFLLVICCVNFVNLYVAKSGCRLKEVGVRKTLGGSKGELFLQFMLEPVILVVAAMLVSVALVNLVLPVFNAMLNKALSFSPLASRWGMLTIAGVTLLIGLVTGVYPAAYLALRTASDMKKKVQGSVAGWFQNGLLIIQFVLSGSMIVLTIVSFLQVRLIQSRDTGYEKDNVLVLQNINMLGGLSEIQSFKNELLRIKGVAEASISGYTPSQNLWGRVRPTYTGEDVLSNAPIRATWLVVDDGFLPTLNIGLNEGRNFSSNPEAEKDHVLINETAARQFLLNREGGALDKEISFLDEGTSEVRSYRVVGVVKDFNFGSLHEPIKPMVMSFGYHRYEMILRLSTTDSRDVVAEVSQLWKSFLPRVAVSYNFLSDRYQKAHEADVSAGRLFSVFGLLNILVACLGLLGLVSHATARRTKEIGVRKLLGASGWIIFTVLSGKFVRLVAVAFFLSLPLAWILAKEWLDSFAYKVPLSVGVFLVTGGLILLMTLTTIGLITYKAARANPADSLKYE